MFSAIRGLQRVLSPHRMLHPLTNPAHYAVCAEGNPRSTARHRCVYVMQLASMKGNNIRSPQSLLIHRLRNCAPIPQDFITSRERERRAFEKQKLEEERCCEQILQFDYEDWCRTQGENELQKRLSPDLLEEKISRWVSQARRTDPRLANTPTRGLRDIAHRSLLKEVCAAMDLPTFQEWCRANGQQIGEEEGVTRALNLNRSDSQPSRRPTDHLNRVCGGRYKNCRGAAAVAKRNRKVLVLYSLDAPP